MDDSTLTCQDEQRRQDVRNKGVNGLDYVEVLDDHDQRELCVHFFGKVPDTLHKANVRIEGGQRVRDIHVVKIVVEHSTDPEVDDCLRVVVDKPGDFSTYKLCLVELDKHGRPTDRPLRGFDPRYACVEFSFKVGCPSDLDCAIAPVCPPQPLVEPEINYLAKDYQSFRQLILDRLALIMPDWQERHAADLYIALVEVLAYAGDYLSYYQDAVATEAYLDTARQRISVHRHAGLVDYQMHEGCNARAWLCVPTDTDVSLDPQDIFFITGCAELALVSRHVLKETDLEAIPPSHYQVFEPLVVKPDEPIQLYKAHSKISFWTWGDEECCLPRGATRATLKDDKDEASKLHLKKGDVLIFQEVIGPKTGNPADAHPTHRCAIRLTKVVSAVDPLYNQPIVEIEWSTEDALPFPLCLSATPDPTPDTPECTLVPDISVACGNVLLVDHGRRMRDPLGTVPTQETLGECVCEGSAVEVMYVPGKFNPSLQGAPLTFSQRLNPHMPAGKLLSQDPRQALPQVSLTSVPPTGKLPKLTQSWLPRYDLLGSQSQDHVFVVEVDNGGRTHLRFGDGELGARPEAGTTFTADYRVGNGPEGNVGAETILYLVTRTTSLSGVNLTPSNPLPAQGGTAPEPMSEVKLLAPYAFRQVLKRAITADDYAEIAQSYGKVQRAAAALHWTGSWYEAQVAIDPFGTEATGKALLRESKGHLYPYRRMGHDLAVVPATYVPLDLELSVCVLPHYLRGHVKAALLDRFSNRVLPNGQLGFFHPDNLTFGEGITVSSIVAAAQASPGVESVTVTKLERLYEGPNHELEKGILPLGPGEIAQLDNNPSFPEHGKLTLTLRGGR